MYEQFAAILRTNNHVQEYLLDRAINISTRSNFNHLKNIY